jgi:hypothetical protein
MERPVTQVLRRTLDRWAKDDCENTEVVWLFFLDALIEPEAKVPGDELLPMQGARPPRFRRSNSRCTRQR